MLRALWDVTQQFQNKNGSILAAGRVYVYYKNRTALAEIFSDEEGTVVNANPVLLDNNGRATVFADTIYSYTIVVCDYYGKELFSQDITLHDAISTAKDVMVMGSNGSIKVDTTTLPNGVQYDLYVNTDIIATKESVANKKDKQNELNFNGSATKTVKSITQYPNGELNVEFEDISAGGISAGTAIDLTDNAVSVKYSKGLEINSDNELQVNTGIIATNESVDEVKTDLNTLTGTVNNHTTQIEQIQQILDSNSWTDLICRPYDSTIKLTIINAGYKNGFMNFNGTVEKINGTFNTNAVNYLFSVDGIALKLDFRNYYGTAAYNSNINLFPCAMAALKNTNTFYIFPTQTCNTFYFNGTVPADLVT